MKKLLLVLLPVIILLSSCDLLNNYGEKVEIKNSEVYYKGDGVTEADAKRLGKYLLEAGWFDEETERSVQLSKDDDTYVIRLVVKENKFDKKGKLNLWKFQSDISENAFKNKKVKVILADTKLNDVEELDPIARLKVPEKNIIYYNNESFKRDYAEKLADFLVEQGYFSGDNEKNVLLTMENNVPVVRFIVNKKTIMNDEEKYVPIFSYMQDGMNNTVFEGEKTKVILTSVNYEDFKKVPILTAEQRALFQRQYTKTDENIENKHNLVDSVSTETTSSGVIRFKD
jgi:hypothetical protein